MNGSTYAALNMHYLHVPNANLTRKHVIRDLRPFICTFARCSESDRLFRSKAEWHQHELQYHAMQWICYVTSCGAIFANPQDLRSHLTKNHSQNPDELVVNQCERATTTLQDQCPFCPHLVSVHHPKNHVGHHLIGIALSTLPQVDLDTDSNDNSSKSGKAEQYGNRIEEWLCEEQSPPSNTSLSVDPDGDGCAFGPSSAYGDSPVCETTELRIPPNKERAEGNLPVDDDDISVSSMNSNAEPAIGITGLTGQLTKVTKIASVFTNQGQYNNGLEGYELVSNRYEQVLSEREKVLGVGHPDTLKTVHEMASIFSYQGEYDKALEWYGRALAGMEKVLGVDHPETLTTVHEMASIFHYQGEYDKELEWINRALVGTEGIGSGPPMATLHNPLPDCPLRKD